MGVKDRGRDLTLQGRGRGTVEEKTVPGWVQRAETEWKGDSGNERGESLSLHRY